MAAQHLAMDYFWVEKSKFDINETFYYERLGCALLTPLADEVAKARQRLLDIRDNMDDELSKGNSSPQPLLITDFLDCSNLNTPELVDHTHKVDSDVRAMGISDMENAALVFIEEKMCEFGFMIEDIQNQMIRFNNRLVSMERMIGAAPQSAPMVCPNIDECRRTPVEEEDDDDVDLFDSDSEDDEVAAKLKEERISAYNAKKSKKPALIAKSSIILDVKPWDDETDMKLLEANVRKIVMDGLLWGASKLVPLAYSIKKLQITCVVEDDKVSIDVLQEEIEEIESVQSVDIAAFNKI